MDTSSGQLPHVLVIEHDALLAERMSGDIACWTPGAVIAVVGSPAEARAVLARDEIHLAVLDIDIPGADGFAELEAFHARRPAMPIVIITERDTQEVALQVLRLGAQDFLAKGDGLTTHIGRSVRYALERHWAGGGLRKTWDKAEEILRSAQLLVVKTDPEGHVIDVNPVAEDVLAHPRQELLGMRWNDFMVPAEQIHSDNTFKMPDVFADTCELWVEGQGQAFAMTTTDGEMRIVSWKRSSLSDGAFTFFGTDITEAHFLRLKQQYSEKLLAATLDAFNSAIAITDANGIILAANSIWSLQERPENRLVYGHSIGSNLLSFCKGILAEGSDTLEALAQGYLDVIAGKRQKYALDYHANTQDSDRWYGATLFGFQCEGILRIGIAVADISHRKLIEEHLRESEERFRLITENAADLVTLLNEAGKALYHSPSCSRLLGYTQDDLREMDSFDLYHPDDRQRVRETFLDLFRSGERVELDYQMLHKNGEWHSFEAVGALVRKGERHGDQVLVVARDVTERKQAEREREIMEVQLRHAQKLESIGQLAAGIAHEINTPTQYIGDNTKFIQDAFQDITKLLGAYEAALASATASAECVANLVQVKESVDFDFLMEDIPRAIQQSLEGIGRVSKIVRAMKVFSHPGGEDPVPIDLNQSLESTVTVSRNEWKYVADMELVFDPDLPPVICFPGEVNQVVLNLVTNATHAISEANQDKGGAKGLITVATRRDGAFAEIRVSDTGTGIPESIQSRIFDPFFTTKTVGKGTGQGLSLAHAVVVNRHAGAIHFETEKGKGTTFIIRLPIQGPASGGSS